MRVSASSTTTSVERVRARPRPAVEARSPLSRSAIAASAREACNAGQAEHQRTKQRDHEARCGDAEIKPDFLGPWHTFGEDQDESSHRPDSDQQSQRSAGHREYQAFAKQLPDQGGARGTEGGANRQLAGSRRGARQQQAGHVGTRDQEHDADGSEEDEECLSNVANDAVVQTLDRHPTRGIRLGGAIEVGSDRVELGAGLFERGAVLQPSDSEEVADLALRQEVAFDIERRERHGTR